jgi:hypothetical protein
MIDKLFEWPIWFTFLAIVIITAVYIGRQSKR